MSDKKMSLFPKKDKNPDGNFPKLMPQDWVKYAPFVYTNDDGSLSGTLKRQAIVQMYMNGGEHGPDYRFKIKEDDLKSSWSKQNKAAPKESDDDLPY